MKKELKVRATLAPAVAVLLVLTGCRSRLSDQPAKPSKSVIEQPAAGDAFRVQRPQLFPLAVVQMRPLPTVLTCPGIVVPDVNRTVHVYSLAAGRVMEVKTELGRYVEKGQPLLLIHSPDLSADINAYLKAEADEEFSHEALLRAQELYSHGAISLKDLQQAEDAERKSRADLTTATQQLRILGADLHHLSPLIEVKAPISGTIVEQNISPGEAVKSVDSSSALFTIADLSRVWILSNVYENDLGKVHQGDLAEVRFNAYPDRVFRGQVDNISRVLDPSTRTAAVRIVLDNPHGMLRPQMFATVRIVSRKLLSRMVIPSSALFQLHDQYWVFVPTGPGLFKRRPVQAGMVVPGGYQEVLSGLEPGEKVVANSLQFAQTVEAEK